MEQVQAHVQVDNRTLPTRLLARLPLLGIALAYALATLLMLWPLPRHAGSTVQDVGDPLFEIWVIRNVQHRLVHDPLTLYDANAFYPFETTLAFSEEAIATALLAWPVQLVTGDEVLAYNTMVIGSFWLLACAVYLLARELGAVRGAAFVAGLLAAFAPARYGELSHLHMLTLGWAPLVLWAVLCAWRTRQRRWLLAGAVFLTLQLLSSLHLAVFTTLLLALSLPFMLLLTRLRESEGAHGAATDGPACGWRRGWLPWRWLAGTAAALVVPYLLLIPTLLPHLALEERWGFERSASDLGRYAAQPSDFLRVYTHNDLLRRWFDDSMTPLFPGLVAVAGVLCAIAVTVTLAIVLRGRGDWRMRVVVLWLAVVALVSGVFALGLELTLAGRTLPGPYRLLYDHIGPLQSVRAVGRYGLLWAIAVPLLAGLGFSGVWEMARRRIPAPRVAVIGVALTLLLSGAALWELRAQPGTAPAASAEQLAVYDWLAGQAPGPVLELPADGLLQAASVPPDGIFLPIAQMYGATLHWNPTVAGYSGFIPPPYFALLEQFRSTSTPEHPAPVDARTIHLVQQLGIRWLIIHRHAGFDAEAAVRAADALPQLQRMIDTGAAVAYAVAPLEVAPPTLELASLPSAMAADVAVVKLWINAHSDGHPAVIWLTEPTGLRFQWINADGEVVLRGELPQHPPVVAPDGNWLASVGLPTPDVPGHYRLEVRGLLGVHADTTVVGSRQIDVGPARAAADVAAAQFRVVALERVEPQRPFTVAVALTLQVMRTPPWDVSATAQLLDASGARLFGEDLTPVGGMPTTAGLAVGEQFTLTFHLPEEQFSTAGTMLLLALYLPTAAYDRVPLEVPGGSVSHEYIVLSLALPTPNR